MDVRPPRRRLKFREWMGLSVVCCSLLGQGEICRVDPRFATPSSALKTYWEALRAEDVDLVAECFADPEEAIPRPGTVWFLPPSQKITVDGVRYAPGEDGNVVATYEVRFVPCGSTVEMRFITGSELMRVRGEWRIVGIAEDVVWPEWKPWPRVVDI